MFCLLWPLVSGAAWLLVVLLLFAGCATVPPPNRLAHYPEADVLFTTPAEVDRLCRLGPQPTPPGAIYRGCYVPGLRLAVVPHGDAENLAHELRHAREGNFHQ
jgi:hypothetical protein